MVLQSANVCENNTVVHVCELQAALPAELWHMILARVLCGPIHDALTVDELSYYRGSVYSLLLVSKTFRDVTKHILSVAFGFAPDSGRYANVVLSSFSNLNVCF